MAEVGDLGEAIWLEKFGWLDFEVLGSLGRPSWCTVAAVGTRLGMVCGLVSFLDSFGTCW